MPVMISIVDCSSSGFALGWWPACVAPISARISCAPLTSSRDCGSMSSSSTSTPMLGPALAAKSTGIRLPRESRSDLAPVSGEVALDDVEVERRQDRRHRLVFEQEMKGLLHQLLGVDSGRQQRRLLLVHGDLELFRTDRHVVAHTIAVLLALPHHDDVAAAHERSPGRARVSKPGRFSSTASRCSVRSNAAHTASLTTVRSRPRSSWYSASAEVPPGDVTMSRSSATCLPEPSANAADPCIVSSTSSRATWRGKPRCTAASVSASMNRKMYVGPVPLTAVAMATSRSSCK